MTSHGFVGNLLIRAGVIDAAGLNRALQIQSERKVTLGRALAVLGLSTEATVAEKIATARHLEHLTDEPPHVDRQMAALLPADAWDIARCLMPVKTRALMPKMFCERLTFVWKTRRKANSIG